MMFAGSICGFVDFSKIAQVLFSAEFWENSFDCRSWIGGLSKTTFLFAVNHFSFGLCLTISLSDFWLFFYALCCICVLYAIAFSHTPWLLRNGPVLELYLLLPAMMLIDFNLQIGQFNLKRCLPKEMWRQKEKLMTNFWTIQLSISSLVDHGHI